MREANEERSRELAVGMSSTSEPSSSSSELSLELSAELSDSEAESSSSDNCLASETAAASFELSNAPLAL